MQRLDANELTKRLIADPALKSFYLSQVKSITNSFVTLAFLGGKIDQVYAAFKDAAFADTKKPYGNADVDNGVLGLKGLIAARAANVNSQIP